MASWRRGPDADDLAIKKHRGLQPAWRAGNPAFTQDSIVRRTLGSAPLGTLEPRGSFGADQILRETGKFHARGGPAPLLASGAQKRAGFCTPIPDVLLMAPVTQAHSALAETTGRTRVTRTVLMLRAESMRPGLRFKPCILPLFCPFVGFHASLCSVSVWISCGKLIAIGEAFFAGLWPSEPLKRPG
jgi:hypothetical protein